MPKRKVELVMDSGAYSAWKRSETLDVDDYITFLRKYVEHVTVAVNLDVIPGAIGKTPQPSDMEKGAKEGWSNLLKIRAAGIPVMPVYHQGEPLYWLEKMIGEGFDYIGISPTNFFPPKKRALWLDDVYEYLGGKAGEYPGIKTHGFGVTSLNLMYRYPWYSCDSTSWLLQGGYGAILIPAPNVDGEYDYSAVPMWAWVSNRGLGKPHDGHVGGFGDDEIGRCEPRKRVSPIDVTRGFDSLPELEQQYLLKFIEGEGFDFEALRESPYLRQRFNCRFFKLAAEKRKLTPFVPDRQGLFHSPTYSDISQPKPINSHLVMVFVVTTSPEHSEILTEEGCKHRLITYYYFATGLKKFDIPKYVETGLIDWVTRRPKKGKRVKIRG